MPGKYVYVISGDHGRVKIGFTDRPLQRLRELQTGSPFALQFVFVGEVNGVADSVEAMAHHTLRDARENGEWFIAPKEAAIAAVMGAAYHLGHAIRPVDPYNLPQWTGRQPWWKMGAGGTALAVYIYVLYITGEHLLTAFIAMVLTYGFMWLLLRSVAKSLLYFQTARR